MKKEELKKLEGLIKNELMFRLEFENESELNVMITKVKTGYKLNIDDLIGCDIVNVELYADCKFNITESELLYLFIKNFYETEINWKNKYIKQTKNFLYRKAKSLELWTRRRSIDKIKKINEDIIERYKQTENYKFEISEDKIIISSLYTIKDQLENKEVA